MGCNYPVSAYRLHSGEVVFSLKKGFDLASEIKVSCGQCTGCRMDRARTWAIRCMHEAQMHEHNCFITLTYNDEHLPDDSSLDYTEFQRFMKRLRKRFGKIKIRFYMAGEYGEKNDRPHYHAILFGINFPDRIKFKEHNGNIIYTSAILDSLWRDKAGNPIGFATVTDCNFQTSQYVAAYIMKKQYGNRGKLNYQIIDRETGEIRYKEREFSHMSVKNGIGHMWYEKYKDEVFPHDRVVVNGMAVKPPQYYYKKLKEESAELAEDVKEKREKKGKEHQQDNTDERLLVKEKVLKARVKFYNSRHV